MQTNRLNTFNQDSSPVSFETATKLEISVVIFREVDNQRVGTQDKRKIGPPCRSAVQATCCGFCHIIDITRTNLEFLETKIFD